MAEYKRFETGVRLYRRDRFELQGNKLMAQVL